MKKAVVLFSGGVESSSVLYHYLSQGWVVYPVYVFTGKFWERLEYKRARALWSHTKRKYKNLMPIKSMFLRTNFTQAKPIKTERELFIPLRNLTLLTAVSSYALSKGAYQIGMGSLGIYPFPDNDFDYIKRVESLVSKGAGVSMHIDLPLFGMEKSQVVQRFKGLVPFQLTFSCINPVVNSGKIIHCGRCIKCKEREEALRELA
ncbi:7-cyano-7-deazaguanine synthase [Thermocrinis sp.]